MTVQPAGREEADPVAARRVEDALRLAERLGGETERLIGQDLPAEILQFAQREKITQIVIGRSRAGLWATWGRALSRRSCARSKNISVHVVIGDAAKGAPAGASLAVAGIAGLPVGGLRGGRFRRASPPGSVAVSISGCICPTCR